MLSRVLQSCTYNCHRFSTSVGNRTVTSSSEVRGHFLDYFSDHGHKIVASSSVVPPPIMDGSASQPLPFVNAGMVCWKKILLGLSKEPDDFKNGVANSQKCVRVGGKDCDMEIVGTNGSHHTFFEMLGSWAFNGAYGKEKACSLAWNLLTGPYQLSKDRLYVTYFGGCPELGLPADEETRDVWLRLGLEKSKILPFGPKDNFWEMGHTGPCGPCTEIHYDHSSKGPGYVNASTDQVVEVWNLVFMDHERHLDGSLSPLANVHVDTGMGLERLTAIQNGSTSNYDTDLFKPLLNLICDVTKAKPYSGSFESKLDNGYRIVADHSRMLAVCLSDGMFPDTSPKLKMVFRRALRTLRDVFGVTDPKATTALLCQLVNLVAESLGHHFTQQQPFQQERVRLILDFEVERMRNQELQGIDAWNKLIQEFPFVAKTVDVLDAAQYHEALKYLHKHEAERTGNKVTGEIAYFMYDSIGLRSDDIAHVAEMKGLAFHVEEFNQYFQQIKNKSKLGTALKSTNGWKGLSLKSLPETDDSWKHKFTKSHEKKYQFPMIEAEILGVISPNGELRRGKVSEPQKCGIILDKTTFYSEAGGQAGDKGLLTGQGFSFVVEDVQKVSPNHVVHIGQVESGSVKAGKRVKVKLDVDHRIEVMQHHTATHLLNSVLNDLLPVTCQKSSHVAHDHLRFDFATFNAGFDLDLITQLEERVNGLIALKAPVNSSKATTLESPMLDKPLITIPGEEYPECVTLIETPWAVEPCGGTHVLNTGDLQAFVVVSLKTTHQGVKSLRCVCGNRAVEARQNGINLLDQTLELTELIDNLDGSEDTSASASDLVQHTDNLRQHLDHQDNFLIPYTVRQEMHEMLEDLSRHLKSSDRVSMTSSLKDELLMVLEDKKQDKHIVHCFQQVMSSKVTLSKLTKGVTDKPILVVARNKDGTIVARATVPKELVNDHFNAFKWLECLAAKLDGKNLVSSPRGQNPQLVVNMKPALSLDDNALKCALQEADLFAQRFVNACDVI